MKLIGRFASKPHTGMVETLIGQNTEILGDIRFSGGLHVDGKIRGKVLADGTESASLSVSETGVIQGDVQVPTIILNGTVVGEVRAGTKLTLAPKSRVTGNVYYKVLEMQGGAQVNGKLLHETDGPHPAALSHQNDDGELTVIEVSDVRRIKPA